MEIKSYNNKFSTNKINHCALLIQKNKLSEIAIYYGDVSMPKGFEIDRNKLQEDILKHQIQDCPFPFSREWDKLTTYLREHINLEIPDNLQLNDNQLTPIVEEP